MRKKVYDQADLQRLGEIIGEHIVGQFRTGFEAIEEIKRQVAKIPIIEEKVDALTNDMQAMKAALKATNQDIRSYDQRITRLETTVYHA